MEDVPMPLIKSIANHDFDVRPTHPRPLALGSFALALAKDWSQN